MPEFVYEALELNTGQIVKDEGEFQDVYELFRSLRARGLILLKYKVKHQKFWERLTYRVTRRELAEFCRNLAFMIRGGVPLVQALSDIARATDNPRLASAIKKLMHDVEAGYSFSESIKSGARIFSPIVEALVYVGEETGRLEDTLEAAAEHLLKVEEIVSNTKRALIYPAFLFSMMSLALAFWIFFVLPRVIKLFQSMHVRLPAPTRFLIAFVEICTNYWYYPVSFVVLFVFLGILAARTRKGRFWATKVLLKVPLFRTIVRCSLMAFFFEYTGLLLQAGIDLFRSVEIMQRSMNSPFMDAIFEQMKTRLREGFSLTEACESTRFFNPLELRMIKIGEDSGRLVEQMRYLAEYYYQSLERLVESLSKVLEPVLLIVAGVIFLILALALIGPIYELISQIGRM